MDYFKNYTPEDLLKVQEMSADEYNNFVQEHHYAKCSACGKEYMYKDSPLLSDDDWKKVKDYYQLEEDESIPVVKALRVGSAEWKLSRVNTFLTVKENSCLICRHCMEQALGHELDNTNTPKYEWNREIFNKN